jgi:hypothetical protein
MLSIVRIVMLYVVASLILLGEPLITESIEIYLLTKLSSFITVARVVVLYFTMIYRA